MNISTLSFGGSDTSGDIGGVSGGALDDGGTGPRAGTAAEVEWFISEPCGCKVCKDAHHGASFITRQH